MYSYLHNISTGNLCFLLINRYFLSQTNNTMPRTRIYSWLLFSLLFILTACTPQHFDFSENIPVQAKDYPEETANQDTTEIQPPPLELLPEPVEDESNIVLELDALRQTGTWEKENTEKDQTPAAIQYDFPVVINKQVEMYLNLFQNRQRKYFGRWLVRSGRYLPMIQAEFKKAGLPSDLAYLAMIESGFNQRAYSHARAVGMWQFMKGTGRDYHLKIDRYVDERRDALKSTQAAAAYLKDLYQQFGDWHLAVAAYNGGPGKVRGGLKRYKVNTFWELAQKKCLRLETKRYVPKLIATIIIARNPGKYGFKNIKYAAPLEYDTIEVGPGLALQALALATGTTKREITLLNQELRTGKTPLNRSVYQVNIPKNTHTIAQQNLKRLHSTVRTGYKTHIKRKGETLAAICRKYNLNTTTLLKVNNLHNGKIQNGQRLRIPYSIVEYTLLPEDGSRLAENRNGLILHTIQKGDTISKIAKKYNVQPDMIMAWNNLKSIHKIRAGKQLALYIIDDTKTIAGNGQNGKNIATEEKRQTDSIIVLAETKKKALKNQTQEDTFSIYHVKKGDTLWHISRRFNIPTAEIKRWNNLTSNLIHPGSLLKLKDV